jgi:hypothetical protein
MIEMESQTKMRHRNETKDKNERGNKKSYRPREHFNSSLGEANTSELRNSSAN